MTLTHLVSFCIIAAKRVLACVSGSHRSCKKKLEGLNVDAPLLNRCYNSDHQVSTIQKLAAFMMDDGPYAMVIIDSVTSLFRVDYVGRGELSVRQQVLGGMLSKLMKLAEEFNVAVLYTNQVM